SGIYNLLRNLGGGAGIAACTTMLARGAQAHQSHLVEHVNAFNPLYREFQATLEQVAGGPGSMGLLYGMVQQQAGLLSYLDAFNLLGWVCLGCLPLVLLLERPRHGAAPAAVH